MRKGLNAHGNVYALGVRIILRILCKMRIGKEKSRGRNRKINKSKGKSRNKWSRNYSLRRSIFIVGGDWADFIFYYFYLKAKFLNKITAYQKNIQYLAI